MEQGRILSSGRPRLTVDEVVQRLARAGAPGRRGVVAGETTIPRGDHDLNPDLYEPSQTLTAAAVLVPIVIRRRHLTVLLTRRTDHLEVHAGQISFPGGRLHEDEDIVAAALRETEEEVGLPPSYIRLIGQLDTYVTRTGFEVTPVVGVVTPPFPLVPEPSEVAEVFEVPLDFFLAPGSRQLHSREFRGKIRHFHVFPYEDYYIWGATAGMLVNLIEVLGAEPPQADPNAPESWL